MTGKLTTDSLATGQSLHHVVDRLAAAHASADLVIVTYSDSGKSYNQPTASADPTVDNCPPSAVTRIADFADSGKSAENCRLSADPGACGYSAERDGLTNVVTLAHRGGCTTASADFSVNGKSAENAEILQDALQHYPTALPESTPRRGGIDIADPGHLLTMVNSDHKALVVTNSSYRESDHGSAGVSHSAMNDGVTKLATPAVANGVTNASADLGVVSENARVRILKPILLHPVVQQKPTAYASADRFYHYASYDVVVKWPGFLKAIIGPAVSGLVGNLRRAVPGNIGD